MDKSILLCLCFHVLTLAIYSYGTFYDFMYVDLPTHKTYGGRLKYLTGWNKYIQMAYFALAMFNDVVKSKTVPALKQVDRSFLEKTRDVILCAVAFPVGIFVVSTFWTLYFINRELVYPAMMDLHVPSWLNHSVHTMVAVYLLIELKIVFREYPSRKFGIAVLSLFAITYLLWISWLAYYANDWVYPVLKVLSMPQRLLFFCATVASLVPLYLLGEFLNQLFWRSQLVVKKTAIS